ncbi:hypothetical protein D4764_0114190 [Takifugu flavidus]|uniref:Uncharacterized protein n=1 Tax=Takifugu flavidus TaxID=433684 RepID=A0A5C6ME83_9TELE|nr:hypothetical protein D4764_0114190 [Takifugu flavidus]
MGRILLPFLSLLSEIKEFMQSRGEDAALLEDTGWTLDLAFLTDITGKRNSLNWELQGKVDPNSVECCESTITNGFRKAGLLREESGAPSEPTSPEDDTESETDGDRCDEALLGLFNSDTEEDDFMGFSQEDESDL